MGARQVIAALLLTAATAVLLYAVHQHYPIQKWLFWGWALTWGLSLVFFAACLGGGRLIVKQVLRLSMPPGEQLVFYMAVGVLVFATGVFVAGLLGWLSMAFFVGWPVLLLILGGRGGRRELRQTRRYLGRLLGLHGCRIDPLTTLVLLFGVAGVVLLYVQILTPDSVSFDSLWYHLPVAERYALTGEIRPYPEAWFHSMLPQLASWLYTWAMLLPIDSLFMRTELAAHLEFTVFLMTLAGVPILVRWLLGGRRVAGAWAGFFLFPGLFLYDSSLGVGADHVLALWTVPVVLAARRLFGPQPVGYGALLGLVMAGAILTKYQSLYLVVGGLFFVAALFISRLVSDRGRVQRFKPAVVFCSVAAGVTLLASCSLWLKNWVWFSNPFYPLAHSVFGGSPWIEGISAKFTDARFQPPDYSLRSFGRGVWTAFNFAFDPHDWTSFHGRVPVFGFLFSLLLPLVLVLRGTFRTGVLAIATLLGVFVWYMTFHQDRYLQALLPWMVAVTVSLLALVWSQGKVIVRSAILLLVAIQIVWGSDVPFFPTHAIIGDTPYKSVIRLASSGFRKEYDARERVAETLRDIGQDLPANANVLLHEDHLQFGLGRRVVADARGRQGRISYHDLREPSAVYRVLKSLGVTHILWRSHPKGEQFVTDDLVFFDFAQHNTKQIRTGRYHVSEMPRDEPTPIDKAIDQSVIATACCEGIEYRSHDSLSGGFGQLPRPGCDAEREAKVAAQLGTLVERRPRFVIVDGDLATVVEGVRDAGYVQLFTFRGFSTFSRAR